MERIEKVKERAKKKKAEELGISLDTDVNAPQDKSNQIILSGTAYYDFNHFADYWKRYRAIVNSGGEESKLKEVFNGEVPQDFDWREYSVMRIPVDKLPDGFMDAGQVGRAKATIHSGILGKRKSKEKEGGRAWHISRHRCKCSTRQIKPNHFIWYGLL